MLVHLKGRFILIGKISFAAKSQEVKFTVCPDDTTLVIMNVLREENSSESSIVEAFTSVKICQELFRYLKNNEYDLDTWLTKIFDGLASIKSLLKNSVRKLIHYVKYYLNNFAIHDSLFSVEDTFWSTDQYHWKDLPIKIIMNDMGILVRIPIDERTIEKIQSYLDDGPEPFISLKYLHSAMNERRPEFRWIDATIAAELAIKEFLIRLKPDIESLILEVPSPPLDKLYGPILESLTGQRSPRLREIRDGVTKRNRLVHRPTETFIEASEAIIMY
jgi:hypothetical protein